MMSSNGPPLMLISSTIPSKPFSRLYRFLKVKRWIPSGILRVGVNSSLSPVPVASGAKAALGALFGLVVVVTHATPAPEALDVHPVGNVGAVTLSKFSTDRLVVSGTPILKRK